METKVCKNCNEEKQVTDFYLNQCFCKTCSKIQATNWRIQNRDRSNQLAIDNYHRRKLKDPQKYTDYWREYKRKYRAEKSKSANQHIITLAH